MNPNYDEGAFLLIDKPLTWTSFDVVKFVRNIIKAKIGHAGTLDPLATGLLILCTGKFTKKITAIQDLSKVYEGEFIIGATTPGFDKEMPVDAEFPTAHITNELIAEAVKTLTGNIQQVPPMFSAKKVNGERVFHLARQGKHIELKANEVTIYDFTVGEIQQSEEGKMLLPFYIKCSKGTYIRSIARDLGLALNSGAYLNSLRRTAIGEHDVKNAITLEQLKAGALKINKPV
jgi:tRNA pseudouridine55 synthase